MLYRDLQLLSPPECVSDCRWVGRIGRDRVTLLLVRQDEHANVNGTPVPELVASAVCVIEGGLDTDRRRRKEQVIQRLRIMLDKITDWVEFANDISEQMHIDVQLEEIEVDDFASAR